VLRVRLLGALRVEIDGNAVELQAPRRARELLALLAVEPGLRPRSILAARLRGDVGEEAARSALRQAASDLRKALGPDAERWLVSSREKLGLDPDAVEVDLKEFRRLVAEGDGKAALELCVGPLLDGFDSDWAEEAKRMHAAELDELLARLTRAAAERGDHSEALRLARRRIELDPLAEAPRREVVALLAARGDRATALGEYGRLRSMLRDELGIGPDAETRRLVERLIAEPEAVERTEAETDARRAPPSRLPAAIGRSHRSPFVGREEEVRRLEAEWEASREEREVRIVFVGGEPGIGKSRLCAEFAHSVARDGDRVMFGRCYEEALVPYQPFVEAIPGLDERLDALHAEQEQDPGAARARLFAAVATLLEGLTGGGPALLVLEDLHWADRGTALLLTHLARSAELAPLLIVGTYRPAETPADHPLAASVAEIRRELLLTVVRLEGLDADEVATIAAAWAPEFGSSSDRLAAETAGNPFFVEEMLYHAAESGSSGVPVGVRDVIGQRLERLGPEVRAALEAGAVLGTSFELEVLAAWEPVENGIAAPLDRACEAELIRAESGAPGVYSFAHALVRAAVYDSLGPARRVELHRAAARAIEGAGGGARTAELSHHLAAAAVSAGDAERAATVAMRAGGEAMEQLAYEAAVLQFSRAVELVERAGAARRADAGRALVALGDALARARGVAAGRECFERAGEIATEIGDPDLLAWAALGRSGIGVTILDVDEGAVALLEGAAEALAGEPPELYARVLARLAIELYYSTDRERSPALSAEAVEAARASGDDATLAFALNARHVALWRPAGLDARVEAAAEMREAARRAGDREAELQATHWVALDAFERGEIDLFEREAAAHERLADELALVAFTWFGPLWRASLASFRGRFDEVGPALEEARAIGRAADDANAELLCQVLEAQDLLARGHADRFGTLGLRTARGEESPAGHAYITHTALWKAAVGDHGAAREALDRVGLDRLDELPRDANLIPTLGDASEAVTIIGDREWAGELYRLLRPLERTNLVFARGAGSSGSGARLLGQLAGVLGRPAEAERHFDVAIELESRWGAEPWLLRSKVGLAEVLARRDEPGDAERAAGLAREVAERAHEIGVAGLAERAEPLFEHAAGA
jgi:DNA-binding SARP family transcriptional activator